LIKGVNDVTTLSTWKRIAGKWIKIYDIRWNAQQKAKYMPMQIDRHDVAELLEITSIQYHRLRKNPTFPKPDGNGRFDRDEVMEFKANMAAGERKGFKVPDCLFKFDDFQGWPHFVESLRRKWK
jgi:hypothetical protein